MRRLFGWMAGLVSVAALAKLAHRWRRSAGTQEPLEPDPAEELRRKLDEVRSSGEPEAPAGTTGAAAGSDAQEEGGSAPTLDERRAAIHAKAQAAIDAMREDER